jgi:hypothetical protein
LSYWGEQRLADTEQLIVEWSVSVECIRETNKHVKEIYSVLLTILYISRGC